MHGVCQWLCCCCFTSMGQGAVGAAAGHSGPGSYVVARALQHVRFLLRCRQVQLLSQVAPWVCRHNAQAW